MIDTPELLFAADAVRRGARLAASIQREMVTPALMKGDRSPVTVADFAVQALVAQRLAEAFPGERLVGEEEASDLRTPAGAATLDQVYHFVGRETPGATRDEVCRWIDLGRAEPAGRFWTLDPVDGTKGFLRREQYAIALALIVDGQVQIGVLGCPNLAEGWRPEMGGSGSLLVAARGQGTYVAPLTGGDFRQIQVSKVAELPRARLLRSYEASHTDADALGQLAATLGATAPPVLMDSQAKYAVLASGAGEFLFRLLSPKQPNYREKIWDQAAGSIVVEEAGGRVSDLDGRPLDFTQGRTLNNNRGVVASNGLLHDAALAALRA